MDAATRTRICARALHCAALSLFALRHARSSRLRAARSLRAPRSGTEDYFLSASYFDEGTFASSQSGLTWKAGDGSGDLSMYKTHTRDLVPFHGGMQYMWRNNEDGQSCPNHASPAARRARTFTRAPPDEATCPAAPRARARTRRLTDDPPRRPLRAAVAWERCRCGRGARAAAQAQRPRRAYNDDESDVNHDVLLVAVAVIHALAFARPRSGRGARSGAVSARICAAA